MVRVEVRRKEGVADPEGNTIAEALARLGYKNIFCVRVSKLFELVVEADAPSEVKELALQIADRVLANPVIEEFSVLDMQELC